jgi:hypothetical protein
MHRSKQRPSFDQLVGAQKEGFGDYLGLLDPWVEADPIVVVIPDF